MIVFLLIIALSPIWITIVAICIPNIFFYKPERNERKCKKYIIRFFLYIIGAIFCPLTIGIGIIAAIVPGTCMLGNYLVKECKRKNKARKEAKKRIKERDEKFRKEEENYKNSQLTKKKKEIDTHTNKKKPYYSLKEPLLQDMGNSTTEGRIVIDIID